MREFCQGRVAAYCLRLVLPDAPVSSPAGMTSYRSEPSPATGRAIEDPAEPCASDESIAIHPKRTSTRVVACFVRLRRRKRTAR